MIFSLCKRWQICISLIQTVVFLIVFPSLSTASSTPQKLCLHDTVIESLQYLFDLLEDDNTQKISMAEISAAIDFVASDEKTWPAFYYSEDNLGARSVYHEFDINQPLQKILAYAYTLEIPSHAVIPSSVRLSHWKNCNGTQHCQSWSWGDGIAEGDFQVLRGVQHETTTPDVFSLTYYSYDLDRILILTRYKNRNVFFSISNQQDKAAGKKAFALGNDNDWNYLYTRETGVNKTGLSWVTPYMYDSLSITVFVEYPDKPSVKCGMFKWLNAGAANINMVQKQHIYEGIKRFETGFKAVLENPYLPEPETLANSFLHIEKLSPKVLKQETARYLENLKMRYQEDDVFQDKKLNEFFTSSDYINQLTREEMKSILKLEYIKTILHKNPVIEMGHLFPHLIDHSKRL